MVRNIGGLSRSVRLGAGAALLLAGMTGDLAAQQVELVSRADPGNVSDTPNGSSFFSSISADGRYVVLVSNAPNLIAGQKDTNGEHDIFLRDQVSGATVLVSHASDSTSSTGNTGSEDAHLSADGRYVLFRSKATNLISGQIDTPGSRDLFLFDRITGAIALVSRSSASARRTGNAESLRAAMSADGRFVVFDSAATDLVKGQNDSNYPDPDDVFLYDRVSGTTVLVSRSAGSATRTGNADSSIMGAGSISSDGSQILFFSPATDLVPGGTVATGPAEQLFLFNRLSGTTTLVSHVIGSPTAGVGFGVREAALSADGHYVAFTSSGSNLVPEIPEPRFNDHLYLYHRLSGAVTLLTDANSQTAAAAPRLSADGRFVAFTNGGDIVLYDRITATRASVTRWVPGNPSADSPSISADGRFIAFRSQAKDLVPGQTDGDNTWDLFLYDHDSRTIRLVSHTADSSTTATGDASGKVSADGRFVGFASFSSEVLAGGKDSNGMADVFLYERSTDNVALVSPRAGASSLAAGSSRVRSVSADGRYVLFQSTASNVVAGQRDVNGSNLLFDAAGYDLFLYDRVTRATVLVSRSAASPTTTGNGASVAWVSYAQPRLSADGRYVLFLSKATDLVPGQNDVNGGLDVFLFDRVTGTTTLVSHSAASPTTTGDAGCFLGMALSADGRYVAFQCAAADLVPGQVDNNHRDDIFLFDRVSGTNILVSHAAGSPTTDGNNQSLGAALSADGRYVAFASRSTNLVPGQSTLDSVNGFLFDRVSGATILTGSDPISSKISADGRYLAFETGEGIYLFDRDTRTATLVAHGGRNAEMSADGRLIAFSSTRTDVVPGQIDANQTGSDIFLYDRVSGATTLVSRGAGLTTTGNRGTSPTVSISADGNRIAFSSSATDLIPGFIAQTPPAGYVFVYHRDTGKMELVSRTPGSPLQPGNGTSFDPILSADGRYIGFESRATDLVAGDLNLSVDVYLYDGQGTSPGTPGPAAPCALLDTRRAADAPALRSDVRRVLTVHGACGVPATAKKVAVKVTVLQPSGKGNLRLYPGNAPSSAKPAATLRFQKGQTRTASYTLPLATNGAGTLAVVPFVAGKGTVHTTVEVTGYE